MFYFNVGVTSVEFNDLEVQGSIPLYSIRILEYFLLIK